MDDPSVKAYLIQNDPLDSSSGAISDESWMDTPLNNGIREITVSIKILNDGSIRLCWYDVSSLG